MKNKLVTWGTNANNERVLIALELQAENNKVMLYTFSEALATDDFVNKMNNEWRNGGKVAFPEGYASLERELSIAEGLLPEELKVERNDVIVRAQTEWHFAVLSAKLHEAYRQELQEYKEKIQALSAYDNGLWENLRGFWDKVQNQARERNLFREHADHLRDNINVLFDDLKKMKNRVQDEFMAASDKVYQEFTTSLEDIEKRIEAGGNKLHVVFDDLKQLQRKYREARLSNEHRNQVWNRLDAAFKAAKERKFGPNANDGSLVDRHESRLNGLREAMKRMEDSAKRDEEELNYQRKRVNATEGQLEAQIRMAKIKMIEERLNSKREKLADMQRTVNDVQRQIETAKDREVRRTEKEADRRRIAEARETARSEIAAKTRRSDAAAKEDNLFEAAGTVLGDVLMDALDSIKAVASVAAEKGSELLHDVTEKASEMVEAMTSKTEEAPEAPAAEAVAEAAAETVAEAAEVVAEAPVETEAEAAEAVAEAPVETVAEAAEVVAEAPAETVAEAAEAVAEASAETVAEAAAETAPEAPAETVTEAAESVAEAAAETVAEAPAAEGDGVEKPEAEEKVEA